LEKLAMSNQAALQNTFDDASGSNRLASLSQSAALADIRHGLEAIWAEVVLRT